MPHPPPFQSQAVFTAGFSTMPVERFLNNLQTHGIDLLVDVRSKPFSRHAPHFNKDQIEALTQRAGLRYRYLGRELGGMPQDEAFYDSQGYVLYDKLAEQPWFEQGIAQVLDDLRQGRRLALACAEADPRACHRRLLLGQVLRQRGIGVAHILASGSLISESELLDEEAAQPRQLSLFGELPQPKWRSATPVAPKE